MHACHIFFIHLCSDGHIDLTHNLVILSTVTNMNAQMAVWLADLDSFGYIPRSDYIDHMIVLFLILFFWGNSTLISIVAVLVYISSHSIMIPHPSTHLQRFCLIVAFLKWYPFWLGWVEASRSLIAKDIEYFFHIFIGHFWFIFEKFLII